MLFQHQRRWPDLTPAPGQTPASRGPLVGLEPIIVLMCAQKKFYSVHNFIGLRPELNQ